MKCYHCDLVFGDGGPWTNGRYTFYGVRVRPFGRVEGQTDFAAIEVSPVTSSPSRFPTTERAHRDSDPKQPVNQIQ